MRARFQTRRGSPSVCLARLCSPSGGQYEALRSRVLLDLRGQKGGCLCSLSVNRHTPLFLCVSQGPAPLLLVGQGGNGEPFHEGWGRFFLLHDSVTFVGALALAVLVVLPNPVAAKKTKIGGAKQEMTEFSFVPGRRRVSFFSCRDFPFFFLFGGEGKGREGERFFCVFPRLNVVFALPFCLRSLPDYSIFCRCFERDVRLACENIRGQEMRFYPEFIYLRFWVGFACFLGSSI